MGILKDRFLITLMLLGLLVRLLLSSLPGFNIDTSAWFAWAIRINQTGFTNFYSDQIWTNYTPGYLYILGIIGLIKNLFHINDSVFTLILKIPSIVAEIVLGLFIYKQISSKPRVWIISATAFVWFNPTFIFNSAVWGQIDGLLSLMLIFSVYFLKKKRLVLSSIFLGLSFLIKPQTIAIFPIFVLFLVKNLSIRNLLKIASPFLLTVFLLSLPFFMNQPFSGLPQLFAKMVSDYSYTSLFAYNLWGIIGFWKPDSSLWIGISYQSWGYILLAGYWAIIGYLYVKEKLSIYALATLATLGFFFLPTRVHERYLYPAIVFLVLLITLYKSKLLLILTGILSLLHLLNLYYVYVYYNELYLKLPKIFYNHFLYNFLDLNSRNISIVSTITFILISATIIKYAPRIPKKN